MQPSFLLQTNHTKRPTLQARNLSPGIQNCHEIRKDPALQVRRVSRRKKSREDEEKNCEK